MLYDFIIIDKNSKTLLYIQIYKCIRNAIENGNLRKNTKLPSIRKLSNELNLSKTTIIAAYDQLCVEGYIKNKPQSGYYVEAQFEKTPQTISNIAPTKTTQMYYEYDFSGKSIDEKIFDISEWKKQVKEVINTGYILTSYGEPQGESILRNALQKYSLGTRSVNANADNIVVGAGTQSLLYILCSLIGTGKTIALSKPSYIQAEIIFRSLGHRVKFFENDEQGVKISSLDKIKPDVIMINPNFISENGMSIPISRRLELIKWAENNNCIIIEDDYNGELRYSTHPVPSVQNYDSKNTVYLGSFSKILLPSVRISYMVLPDKLINKYANIKQFVNQTASKTEQIALAKYIESRKFDTHLRKARRVYLEKSKIMLESITKYFKGDTKILFNETSLYVSIKCDGEKDHKKIIGILDKNHINIMPQKTSEYTLSLSFSGIKAEKIENGIKKISSLIFNNT